MHGRLDIIKAFEREPTKSFSTTMLVEQLYPQHMRSIREQLQFGSKEQSKASQALKSRLHRQTLYHLGKLVEEQALVVSRIDAHGEKIYTLAKPSVKVESRQGMVQIKELLLKTHFIEAEKEEGICQIYEEQSALFRVNAFYIDASAVEGLGKLTQLLESTLKIVNDVVCIGDFQELIRRYTEEDLEEFIKQLAVLTLNEAKAACLCLDTRLASCSKFIAHLSAVLPKRVYVVFVVDQKSMTTPDFQACVEHLQLRRERINIHYAPLHPYPLFLGKAGPYGIDEESWRSYKSSLSGVIPGFVASQATVMVDMKTLEHKPAHDVRDVIMHAAKALHSMASQQRQAYTAVADLQRIHKDTHLFFQCTTNYLRFWNYNWESSEAIIESCAEDLDKFVHTQETIYRACGLPFHFSMSLSSAFSKSSSGLSSRVYRKWMVSSEKDLQSESFNKYVRQRLSYLQQFRNIDRFRVFRQGTPTPEQVAKEALLICQRGFPLVAIDFRPLQGMKQLTEYFT